MNHPPISSEWNKSVSSGLPIKIFGRSPSFVPVAPPELSPRGALCPWRYMTKPLGVTGLWVVQRQWTQASQHLGCWASLLLPSPPSLPCDSPDSSRDRWVQHSPRAIGLEFFVRCLVPIGYGGWMTLHHERVSHGGLPLLPTTPPPAPSRACWHARSSHTLEYCFLLSAWVGAPFPYSC